MPSLRSGQGQIPSGSHFAWHSAVGGETARGGGNIEMLRVCARIRSNEGLRWEGRPDQGLRRRCTLRTASRRLEMPSLRSGQGQIPSGSHFAWHSAVGGDTARGGGNIEMLRVCARLRSNEGLRWEGRPDQGLRRRYTLRTASRRLEMPSLRSGQGQIPSGSHFAWHSAVGGDTARGGGS